MYHYDSMSLNSAQHHLHELVEDVDAVEHLLNDGISPDTSLNSGTISSGPLGQLTLMTGLAVDSVESMDINEVDDMLSMPDCSHKFDIGTTILECEERKFEGLNIECHTFICDLLAKPDNDTGYVKTQTNPQLLPFPMCVL